MGVLRFFVEFAKDFTFRHASRPRKRRNLHFEALEYRVVAASDVLRADFDGTIGSEIAVVSDRSIVFTSSDIGSGTPIPIEEWSTALVMDLNQSNGADVLLVPYRNNSNAIFQIATIGKAQVSRYAFGSYSAYLVDEFDGSKGLDVLVWRNNSDNSTSVGLIRSSSGVMSHFNIPSNRDLSVHQLDSSPSKEIVFDRGRSDSIPRTISVLNGQTENIASFTLPTGLEYTARDLDGLPGDELLFTRIATLNGVPLTSSATVLSYATREIRTYDAGRPTDLMIRDLDGLGGPELVFSDLNSLTAGLSDRTVTVINHALKERVTYNVGRQRNMQAVDLDGLGGPELLLTSIVTINGVPRPSSATVISYATRDVRTYDAGSPTDLMIRDLDGLGGPELVFSDLNSLTAGSSIRTVTVINHALKERVTYNVGRQRNMQAVDLDGLGGPELLLTSIVTINGVPQASSATVINYLTREIRTYDVGRPTDLMIRDLDGLGGPELVFSDLNSLTAGLSDRTVTVINHTLKERVAYNVGRAARMQAVNLDTKTGDELILTSSSNVFVITFLNRNLVSLNAGVVDRWWVLPFDQTDLSELYVRSGSNLYMYSYRLRRFSIIA